MQNPNHTPRCCCSACNKYRTRICQTCGCAFRSWKSKIKNDGPKYCSAKCYNRLGEMNSNWKGGRGIDPRGAAWVYVPGSSDGIIKAHTISEYRLIAAKRLVDHF